MRVQPVVLTFQQWVEYVFDRPLSDPAWYWSHDEDGEDLNCWQPDPTTLVDYLTRLFEEPAFLADRYTPEQLNQGFWFLFYVGSEYFGGRYNVLYNASVPKSQRLRMVRSCLSLYEKLFARVCSNSLSHLNEPGHPLNLACYMWWDLGGLTPVADPQAPHDAVLQDVVDIDHAKLDVLREALAVPSVACQESALHGLGHFRAYYRREVEDIVTDFLARHQGLRSELSEYAAKARSGAIL